MNKIIIAAHKPYAFPADDLYLPLQVGAAGHDEILDLSTVYLKDGKAYGQTIMRDDMDENISDRNKGYSELTGLYWAWKNLHDADVIGLVHYRRMFTAKSRLFIRGHEPLRCVLTEGELEVLLSQYDILVPKKRIYAIETLYSHYDHTLDGYQLDAAFDIIKEDYPGYVEYIEPICRRRWGYMFNMMIMRRRDIEDYCSWLFSILFKLEDRLKNEGYLEGLSAFEARLFGRVSEILFNIWLEDKIRRGRKTGEVAVLSTEPENWTRKISSFMAAKFGSRKYGESF